MMAPPRAAKKSIHHMQPIKVEDVEDVVEIVEVVAAAEVVHHKLVSCKKSTKTRTSKSSPTCTGSILSLVRQEAATRCKSSLIFPTS